MRLSAIWTLLAFGGFILMYALQPALLATQQPVEPEAPEVREAPFLPEVDPPEIEEAPAPAEALGRVLDDSPQMQERRLSLVERFIMPVVSDEAVLEAMRTVPRHSFVPESMIEQAYTDQPLILDVGSVMPEPSLVAQMVDLLDIQPGDRVLKIGTGSGYQAAVLRELTDEVFSVETSAALAEVARGVLDELGYRDITLGLWTGDLGWEEHAPYDAILVSASLDYLPSELVEQLNPDGGRMLIPVGPENDLQTLWLVTREGGATHIEALFEVSFIPLPDTALVSE